jgi:diguanylate cyclase (GGDEF)-like protein/PAS domain S-box-containing protein
MVSLAMLAVTGIAAAAIFAAKWLSLRTANQRERILAGAMKAWGDAELLTPDGIVLATGGPLPAAGERAGRHLWGLHPFAHDPAIRERVRDAVMAAARGEIPSIEIDLPASYGKTHTLELRVRPVSSGGRIRQLVATTTDITARRAAELLSDEFTRRREFYLQHTPLAIIEWSPDLRVQRWSYQAEIMFGWTENEALGHTSIDLGMNAENERVARTDLRQAADGKSTGVVIRQFRRKDGRSVWAETSSSAMRGPNGEIQAIIMLAHDVTERHVETTMLRDSERLYRRIFDNAAAGLALLDRNGRWLMVNEHVSLITGYSTEELLKLDYQSITHPEDLEADVTLARQVINGERDSYELEKRYIRKDGTLVWILLHVRRLDNCRDSAPCFVSVIEDISERKSTEESARALSANLETQVAARTAELETMMQRARLQHAQLALATEMNGLLPAAHDVRETASIVARYMPQVFSHSAGALYFEDAVSGRFVLQAQWGGGGCFSEAFESADCWALRRCQEHRANGENDPLRCRHLSAEITSAVCIPLVALGEVVGVLELAWSEPTVEPDDALLRTIAEQVGLAISNLHLRDELRKQAFYDPLTGLYNRRSLDDHLRRRASDWARNQRGYGIVMIDVDHFKSINDRFGHDAGDQVLREVAALLRCVLRNHDIAFRHGGEEFLLVIESDGADGVTQCAERIRQEIESLRVTGSGQILPAVTVSIGIACCPDDGDNPAVLRGHADQALYAAKAAGRNRVLRYLPDLDSNSATA